MRADVGRGRRDAFRLLPAARCRGAPKVRRDADHRRARAGQALRVMAVRSDISARRRSCTAIHIARSSSRDGVRPQIQAAGRARATVADATNRHEYEEAVAKSAAAIGAIELACRQPSGLLDLSASFVLDNTTRYLQTCPVNWGRASSAADVRDGPTMIRAIRHECASKEFGPTASSRGRARRKFARGGIAAKLVRRDARRPGADARRVFLAIRALARPSAGEVVLNQPRPRQADHDRQRTGAPILTGCARRSQSVLHR